MPAESNIHLKVTTSADTAGLDKAVAGTKELEQATKKAADTTGYYLDTKGRLHEESGRFVSTKGVEMKAIAEELRLQPAVSRANQELAESKRKLTAEGGKMKSGLVGNSQAMLQLSRGVQDAQYGIGGMVNNVEGLVMALGGGAGLAGALTVAFVALDILVKNTDLFGSAASKTKKELEDLAEDSRKAADEAAMVAQETKASTEAQDSYQKSLSAVTAEYERQVDASTELRKSREQEIRLKQIEGDAAAELAMAETEDALARGAISPAEADTRRSAIARGSSKRKFEADQEKAKAIEADLIRKANAERTAAAGELTTASRLQSGSEGLLTSEERKEAEKRLTQRQAEAKLAKQKSDAAENEIVRAFHPGGIPDAGESHKKRQQELKAAAEEAQRLADEEAARVKADADARARTGADDPTDIAQRVDELRKSAAERQRAAEQASREAKRSAEARNIEGGAFSTRQRAGDLNENARVRQQEEQDRERRRELDERNRRARDAAIEARKSALGEAGQSAGSLAEMGRAAGMNPAALAKLQQLGSKVAGGDTSAGVLNALDSLLTAFGKSAAVNAMMAGKIAKMEKELNDATAALATLREGH